MSLPELPEEDFATRRALLAAEISRQRGELAEAYRAIEKPIRYTEYGLRGIGFLRSNPWLFAAVPAGFSILSTLFGSIRKPSSKPDTHRRQAGKEPAGLKKAVLTYAGHGWRLYQLYRRVRTYLP